MKRSFTLLMIVLAFGFTTLPMLGQETNVQNEETLSLENVTQVNDVDKWLADSQSKAQHNYVKELHKISIKAGDKILEIAQTDEDKKKGYQLKVATLSSLVKYGEKG